MKMKFNLHSFLPMLDEKIGTAVCERLKAAGIVPETATVKRVECKAQDPEPDEKGDAKAITIYASTRDMDRDNEILFPKGCDLSEFNIAGAILEGHNYQKPQIGKATKVTCDDYGVKMRIEFAPTEDGEKYWNLAKFMPLQASVGFIPLDIMDKGHDEWDTTLSDLSTKWPEFKKSKKGVERFIRKWMLLETSIVPVPCNPHAVQQAIAKAVTDGKIKASEAKLVCKSVGVELEHEEPDEAKAMAEFLKLVGVPTLADAAEWVKTHDHKPIKKDIDPPAPAPVPVKAVELVSAVEVKGPMITPELLREVVLSCVKDSLDLAVGKV